MRWFAVYTAISTALVASWGRVRPRRPSVTRVSADWLHDYRRRNPYRR